MRKTGKFDAPAKVRLSECSVDGCSKKPLSTYHAYCSSHYAKIKRHGDANFKMKLKHEHGDIFPDSLGYLQIYLVGPHPLKTRQDRVERVFHHRYVLFNALGPGDQNCHWCKKRLRWKSKNKNNMLCVDHLDEDKHNNDLENLVPSCVACNNHRGAFIRWVTAHVDDPYLLSRIKM